MGGPCDFRVSPSPLSYCYLVGVVLEVFGLGLDNIFHPWQLMPRRQRDIQKGASSLVFLYKSPEGLDLELVLFK